MIETSRLLLRMFTPDDVDAMWAIEREPEVMKYVGKGARTLDETRERLLASIRHWQQHGFGMMAVVHKETGRVIGRGGLCYLDGTPEVEVGYVLDKPFWGMGLATEIASGCIRYGFEVLKLGRIVAIARPENLASRHVMQKLGMVYEKDARFYHIDSVYYAINRASYQQKPFQKT